MQTLELCETVLTDIIVNDTPFAEALKKIFKANVDLRPQRNVVASLVGCELRHHLLFTYLLKPIESLSDEERRLACLCLAEYYFYQRLNKEEVDDHLLKKLGEEKCELLKPIFEKAGSPDEYIPSDLPKSSNKYLSLRYNTPEWVLKIIEHYGFGTTYKVLRKNSQQRTTTVRIADGIIPSDICKDGFTGTPAKDVYYYKGKDSLRKLPALKEGKLFVERIGTKYLLDKYAIENTQDELFIFDGNGDSGILREALEKYGSTIGMNLGVYSMDKYADVTRAIRTKGLKNVNFFAADPTFLDAAISRPQDLVICAPSSTNFDLIREQPDYLLHFKKDGMDELFSKEKEMLEGVSKVVAENGLLIYVVYTISKKEGHNTISDFIANHKEFKFVKEEQIFPQDELDTAMYYCVMQKKTDVIGVDKPASVVTPSENAAFSMSAKER
ncbi:MAG: hypothetical protein MJ238_03310 [Bacilli bacterium]|nr:hypothetical protein [Bacilli bacterium]